MKLGMIAGSGDLPQVVANHRRTVDEHVHVLLIKGFEQPWVADFSHDICGIAELGKMVKSLKAQNCDTLTLIGNVKRPDFGKIKADLKGMSLLPRIIRAAKKGDDALLRTMVEIFEEEGFRVIGVQDLLEDLVLPPVRLTDAEPSTELADDVRRAFDIAGVIGSEDIGQGCVVCSGLVLAVEAQEGTDEMLKRVARLPSEIRGTEDQRRGVLVKRPKPIQEQRVDLPVIGPSTIRLAATAGLVAVCGVENGALWVAKEESVALAESLGVSLISLCEDGSLP
ncbi:MAG: UDP-2,3-diacylglucosamine pyrophosphatase [Ponticaulis sp.]|nr:UDP-2,3-diacylglucosamine pyrophosphatase [Ponticaulis sp.]|tara:strand:- start:46203 stop:47045 length:843 start_codon:yes stop_codon:yes gene_type:complete